MELTTGLPAIDELIGGLQIGDNVVWEVIGSADQAIIRSFVCAPSPAGLVYVTFTEPASDVLERFRSRWRGREVLLLDCFSLTDRPLGRSAYGEHRITVVGDPRQPAEVLDALRDAEASFGPGTTYVFDNLTAMQDMWGPEEALKLFLEYCPRLYELRTVAYWFLRKEAHDASFLARLQRTTQVVFDTRRSNGSFFLRVAKASGRNESVGRVVEFRVTGDRLEILRHQTQELTRTGKSLKERRLARGMSQAELARRLGISPSALSQAEAGRRGLSEETIKAAYSVLGPDTDMPALPYTLARRRARRSQKLAVGLVGEEVVDDPSRMSVHLLEFSPGAQGRRPPFATKQREVVVLMSGVLELHIGGAREVLQAGDAIVLRNEPASAWSNPGSSPARALWCILPPTE
ncbi:MAG TPA: helix-turn-helix domain-containing protein [Actinomycetota bacterium]|nr:helix-turn-helix domain-containing protein [Actinomycetota bacterium]